MIIGMIFGLILLVVIALIVYQTYRAVATRDFSYLKWVIYGINIGLFVFASTVLFQLIFDFLGLTGGLDWLQSLLKAEGENWSLSLAWSKTSLLSALVELWQSVMTIGLLVCLRTFMKNILAEEIFVTSNIRLARLTALFLLLLSLARPGIATISFAGPGLPATNISFFSLNYLLAAVLVWTLSIILEKAKVIADENDFTI